MKNDLFLEEEWTGIGSGPIELWEMLYFNGNSQPGEGIFRPGTRTISAVDPSLFKGKTFQGLGAAETLRVRLRGNLAE